jgi:hypothetical protein
MRTTRMKNPNLLPLYSSQPMRSMNPRLSSERRGWRIQSMRDRISLEWRGLRSCFIVTTQIWYGVWTKRFLRAKTCFSNPGLLLELQLPPTSTLPSRHQLTPFLTWFDCRRRCCEHVVNRELLSVHMNELSTSNWMHKADPLSPCMESLWASGLATCSRRCRVSTIAWQWFW